MKQLIILAFLLTTHPIFCGQKHRKEEVKTAPAPSTIICHARAIVLYNDDPAKHTVEIFQDRKKESRRHIQLEANLEGILFCAKPGTTPIILELAKYKERRKIMLFNTGEETKEFFISKLFQ